MTLVKLNNKPAFGRFFDDDFVRDFFHAPATATRTNTAAPQVNVLENDNAFVLEVSAPGIAREDLKVNVDGKRLTVSYEHNAEGNNEQTGKTIRREFVRSSFSRTFNVPQSVNLEAVEAAFENGVLTLTLPKREEVKPLTRQIEIR